MSLIFKNGVGCCLMCRAKTGCIHLSSATRQVHGIILCFMTSASSSYTHPISVRPIEKAVVSWNTTALHFNANFYFSTAEGNRFQTDDLVLFESSCGKTACRFAGDTAGERARGVAFAFGPMGWLANEACALDAPLLLE